MNAYIQYRTPHFNNQEAHEVGRWCGVMLPILAMLAAVALSVLSVWP